MKIVESPREGMQGFSRIIPTGEKVRYINQLLRAGFDTVEVGSIVSPKVIPQMADSLEVFNQLDIPMNGPDIMFLAVHARGAEILSEINTITHISYPFSFCPTFLQLNVNTTVERSFETTELVTSLCQKNGKKAVIYISMAFGNPYGDPWNIGLLAEWVEELYQAGARIIPLSNVSMEIDAGLISQVYSTLIPMFPEIEFGLHLHTANQGWYAKVDAAYRAGCRRFDGVINGWGGCPMAGKELLGNLKTENIIEYMFKNEIPVQVNPDALKNAYRLTREIFNEE